MEKLESTPKQLSPGQTRLTDMLWDVIKSPTSFLNSGSNSPQLVFTAAIVNKAFQLVRSEPVDDDLVNALANFLKTTKEQVASAKLVDKEIDSDQFSTIGILSDGEKSSHLIHKILPDLHEIVAKKVGKFEDKNTARSKAEQLLESVGHLIKYTSLNLHLTEAGGFEFTDFDKINASAVDALDHNRTRVLRNRVILLRTIRVTRVFLIERVECSDCVRDKLLMDGIKDTMAN